MKTIFSCYYARTHKRQFLGSNCSEKWMGTTHHCQSHLRMSLGKRKRNHSNSYNHRRHYTYGVPRLCRQLHGAALGSGRAVVCRSRADCSPIDFHSIQFLHCSLCVISRSRPHTRSHVRRHIRARQRGVSRRVQDVST